MMAIALIMVGGVTKGTHASHSDPGAATGGPYFDLHLLEDPTARCLDGSPAAFYVGRPAIATTKWLLWGEGKAWCLSDADCAARAQSKDGG
jgi:hypothetical protein